MPSVEGVRISELPQATTADGSDVLAGVQYGTTKRFPLSVLIAWIKSHIGLTAADVGAQPTITASGILKGDGAGGVSAATAGTDYQAPLTAGTDYATPGMIPTVPSAYTSNPAMDGTASPGSSGSWAKGDHVHPSDTSKANETEIAYVETGTRTSRAYSVGEYFCWNGLLYRVKTAISSGGDINPGANCEVVTGGGLNILRLRTTVVDFDFSSAYQNYQLTPPETGYFVISAYQSYIANEGDIILYKIRNDNYSNGWSLFMFTNTGGTTRSRGQMTIIWAKI